MAASAGFQLICSGSATANDLLAQPQRWVDATATNVNVDLWAVNLAGGGSEWIGFCIW